MSRKCQWSQQGGSRLTPSRETIRSSRTLSRGGRKEKLTSRCQCFGNLIWNRTYGSCICSGYASSLHPNWHSHHSMSRQRHRSMSGIAMKTAVKSGDVDLMIADFQRTSLGSLRDFKHPQWVISERPSWEEGDGGWRLYIQLSVCAHVSTCVVVLFLANIILLKKN